jgi:hypothetical protein
MIKRIVILMATLVLGLGGVSLATAAPAAAAPGGCVTYLESINQDTVARQAICTLTEATSGNISPQFAFGQCRLLMETTGLPSLQAWNACAHATS